MVRSVSEETPILLPADASGYDMRNIPIKARGFRFWMPKLAQNTHFNPRKGNIFEIFIFLCQELFRSGVK